MGVLDVLEVLAVLVALVVLVVQEGDDQRVLDPDAASCSCRGVQFVARQQAVPQERPGAGAVDEASPGPSIDRACSADTSPAMRSTVPVSRASISSLSDCSIVFRAMNPRVQA